MLLMTATMLKCTALVIAKRYICIPVAGTTSGISAPSVYPHLEEIAQGLCLCVRTGAGLMLVWWSLQSLAT